MQYTDKWEIKTEFGSYDCHTSEYFYLYRELIMLARNWPRGIKVTINDC